MVRDEVGSARSRGSVDIVQPVEERLRRIAAAVGGGAVVGAVAGFAIWRPSVLGFPDAGLFLLCTAAATIGIVCLCFAVWGGEWVVTFEAASGTVRRELRTFGNLAVVDGFVFEDLSGLCAVRDRTDGGDDSYRLFMVESGTGRPLHLGDFADETAMRRAAQEINAVHPGLRVG